MEYRALGNSGLMHPPLIYPYWHQTKTARDRLSPADLSLLGPYL